jgi:hypothetical protein
VFFLKIVSNGYHFTLELKFKFVAVWSFVGEFAERLNRGVVLERISGELQFYCSGIFASSVAFVVVSATVIILSSNSDSNL